MHGNRKPLRVSVERLRRPYLDDGVNLVDLAREGRLSPKRLREELVDAGVPIRKTGRQIAHPLLGDVTWLREQYVTRYRSAPASPAN